MVARSVVFLLGVLLCVSLAFGAEVTFQWGMSSGQVDGYRVYFGDSRGGPYPEQLCEVNGTTLNCVASLNDTIEYCLICRAFNAYGESGNSNELRWSSAVPGTPGNLHWILKSGRVKYQYPIYSGLKN